MQYLRARIVARRVKPPYERLAYPTKVPVRDLNTLLPIHFFTIVPWKPEDDGLQTWVHANYVGDQNGIQVAGFSLAQSWLLKSFEQ